MEAEENDGTYDDDGFEDYSDEFDGDDEDPPPPTTVSTAKGIAAAAITRPVSARGGGGAVVSSALKTRKTGDVQAADDKVDRNSVVCCVHDCTLDFVPTC